MREKVEKIIEEIRPRLQGDGGDVQLVDVDENTGEVKVTLRGACAHCPHATATIRHVIERIIKEHVPEVTTVTNVTSESPVEPEDVE